MILALVMAFIMLFGIRIDTAIPKTETEIVTQDGNVWGYTEQKIVFATHFTNDKTDDEIIMIF